jgi:uncharacterized protein (TIGR02001 family)
MHFYSAIYHGFFTTPSVLTSLLSRLWVIGTSIAMCLAFNKHFIFVESYVMKKTLLSMVMLSSLLVAAQAQAGASANVGVTNNYIWRGITQTQDSPALQAGLDYAHDSGLYAGTWVSNTEFAGDATGPELDLYAGYKKDLKGEAALDVGVINYSYPDDNSAEFTEAYAKASLMGASAEVDYTIDSKDATDAVQKGDVYLGLGYGKEINGITYGGKVGRYNFKADGADYSNMQLSATKSFEKVGDVTLAVDKANGGTAKAVNGDNDPRLSVQWKKSFDF